MDPGIDELPNTDQSPSQNAYPRPSSPTPIRPISGQILRILTATQNTSALVFSAFLTVHLASPLAAAFLGGSGADKTMLIGRDYYLPLEPLLVYAPLAIHLTSSLSKRAIIIYRTRRLPPQTSHIIAGYALVPFVLPHILIHRIIPQSPEPPISNLGPSEFGWEFVGWTIQRWPGWSAVGYLGLVGIGTWHAGVGMMKVVTWIRGPRRRDVVAGTEGEHKTVIPRRRRIGLRGILAAVLGVVSVGLVRMHGEGKGVSPVMTRRYEAVYARLPWSGLLR